MSVNAHYISITKDLNVIDEISIRAVDDTMSACTNIRIALAGCTTFVNGISLSSYSMNGTSIRHSQKSVRVSMPNCDDLRLVMHINCRERLLYNPNGTTSTIKMLHFNVTRGLNLGHRNVYGLLGILYSQEYNMDWYLYTESEHCLVHWGYIAA